MCWQGTCISSPLMTPSAFRPDTYARPDRRGFTLAEIIVYLVIIALVGRIALPSVNRTIRQQRVIAASAALAADVDAAFSVAARQRRPVRLTYDASSGEVRAADRATGTVYRRRSLRDQSEFKLTNVVIAPPTVDLFPSGIASAGFTITLTNGAYQRQVAVTRTGLSRILP